MGCKESDTTEQLRLFTSLWKIIWRFLKQKFSNPTLGIKISIFKRYLHTYVHIALFTIVKR